MDGLYRLIIRFIVLNDCLYRERLVIQVRAYTELFMVMIMQDVIVLVYSEILFKFRQ